MKDATCVYCLAAIYNGMDKCHSCFLRSRLEKKKIPKEKSTFGKWKTAKYGKRDK